MSPKIHLNMPQPGETITEGTIIKWLIKSGATVKEKQAIVELETEKAVFEYESPYEGKLVEIIAKDGSKVPVGSPIAVFDVSAEKAKTYAILGIGKTTEAGNAPQPPLNLRGGEPQRGEGELPKKTPHAPRATLHAPKLSPLIRHLMQEHNLSEEDLASVEGSGPGGRITKEDIQSYLESRGVGAGFKPARTAEDVSIVPASPIRLRIAENMIRSKQTVPHAHTGLEVDMTKVVAHRNRIKKEFEKKQGIPLGILPLIFPALKKAIAAYPIVNASFNEKDKTIVTHKKIHLGVATDTERGLLLPVLHDAGAKSVVEFAKLLVQLTEKAKSGRLSPAEMTGMTFTFNNYGFYGATIGVQIILPPQSTTLGMGRIEKRPWVKEEKIEIRDVANFTIAFDHRLIDGRDAGLFLSFLKKSLESFQEGAV